MVNEEYKLFLQGAKKRKISENFTLFEVIYSDTALKLNIDNRPTTQIVHNATLLIKNVLQPLREHFNKAVKVHSFYRSVELNTKIGGVKPDLSKGIRGSQHMYGEAVDITVEGHSIQQVFDYIKNNLLYDQLIHEGTWIHVSFNPVNKNRKQTLRLINGKYISA